VTSFLDAFCQAAESNQFSPRPKHFPPSSFLSSQGLPHHFLTSPSLIPAMAHTPMPSALTFELIARCSTTKARAANLTLPHGPVQLPLFMPVATQASLKGLTPQQLEATGCRLCLNNTYHLGLKPGQEVLEKVGGAHKLQGWKHNILTDSGGYGDQLAC